MLRISKVD